jgi:hypothetical protein
VGGLVLLAVFVHRSTSDWIRNKIQSDLYEACPKCELKLGAISFSWIPGKLLIRDLEFTGDPSSATGIDFSLESISLKGNLSSVFGKAVELSAIEIVRAKVVVSEVSDGPPGVHSKFPLPGHATAWLPPLRISSVKVIQSEFTYALKVSKKSALLQVRSIDANTGPLVTRANLLIPPQTDSNTQVHLELSGTLERTGRLDIKVEFEPFARVNHDLVEIRVRDQNLSELNSFFLIEDGLRLSGTLDSGLARFRLTEGKLTGTLHTHYQNLDLNFSTDPRHGLLKTLIAKLVSQGFVKTRPINKEDRAEVIVLEQRKPFQPITQFLLQGLKSGANAMLRN